MPFVDRRRFASVPDLAPTEGPLRLLYAGTVGLAQGLRTLVEAARLAGPDVVRVTIAGGGAELDEVRDAACRARADVNMLGVLPVERIPELYAESDAAAVLLRDRPVLSSSLPTKMFEAMAAGRALLLSARGEAADLVERLGCGLVVRPEDPRALADAITRFHGERRGDLVKMGTAGHAAAAQHDLESAVDTWRGLLEGVAAQALKSHQ